MLAAGQALDRLADQLREGDSMISAQVADPAPAEPALALLVAAGPNVAAAPGEYALVIEAIREGYLLHYGDPRLVVDADDDFALLAGDYLYALGLERLAALRDLDSVQELADLISLSAQLHAEGREGVSELWLASPTAIAVGPSPGHERAKAALRRAEAGAPEALWRHAARSAGRAAIGDRLDSAAEAIGFQPHQDPP